MGRSCVRIAIAAVSLSVFVAAAAGQAIPYRSLYNFGGTVKNADGVTGPDGQYPSTLTFDSFGNVYGTTIDGGAYGDVDGGGIVFEITKAGVYRDLHDFGGTVTNENGKMGPDGVEPSAGVTLDAAGDLFGVTTAGGPHSVGADGGGAGMVWEITAGGRYVDLHDFGGTVVDAGGKTVADGQDPLPNLVFDRSGNLYGTTANGGANLSGMVFELMKSGGYADLHDFGGTIKTANGRIGPDGSLPTGGLAVDSKGDVFGSAYNGGDHYVGMIWELAAGATYRDLHDFGATVTNANGKSGLDGANPTGSLALDADGNLYGTTQLGGPANADIPDGEGVLWEFTSGDVYEDIHDFGGTVTNSDGIAGPDGQTPNSGVVVDRLGNLYGTTDAGGANDFDLGGDGMAWELTAARHYQDLHDFGASSTDGLSPDGGVTLDAAGNIYGACTYGGANGVNAGGDGMLWLLPESTVQAMAVSPTTVTGGASAIGSVTLAIAAPIGGATVLLKSSSAKASVPISVTVGSGATTAGFTIKTVATSAQTAVTVSGTLGAGVKSATLTVQPPVLSKLSLGSSSVIGGASCTATVTLSGPAPTGGFTIALSSSIGSASVPGNVTVPAGAGSATFTITTSVVNSAVTVTITAKAGSVAKTATLKVEP